MSGGYFENSYFWNLSEELEGQWRDEEINELFYDLFVGSDFSPRNYGGLYLALDFWLSGDTTEENYRKNVAKFKHKWLDRTPGDRIEFYQKRLQEYYDKLKREIGECVTE